MAAGWSFMPSTTIKEEQMHRLKQLVPFVLAAVFAIGSGVTHPIPVSAATPIAPAAQTVLAHLEQTATTACPAKQGGRKSLCSYTEYSCDLGLGTRHPLKVRYYERRSSRTRYKIYAQLLSNSTGMTVHMKDSEIVAGRTHYALQQFPTWQTVSPGHAFLMGEGYRYWSKSAATRYFLRGTHNTYANSASKYYILGYPLTACKFPLP